MPFFDRFRKKKNESASKDDHAPRHCFVLCNTDGPYDLSNAASVVSDVFGTGYSADHDGNNLVTVTFGGETIGFLAHMPAPIPGGEAEKNADGNFLWPEGRKAVADHRAHIIVTNIGAGDQSPVQSAIAISRLAIVGLRLFDGLGVYWGNACVCNSRTVFEGFCQDMSEDQLSVPMWLRFQLFRTSDGNIGMYTLGMSQFGLMDIEVERCTLDVRDLFGFVSNIAHYLIQRGPVIADGNTVGGSAEERILVHHRPSMIDKKKKVYKIVFDA